MGIRWRWREWSAAFCLFVALAAYVGAVWVVDDSPTMFLLRMLRYEPRVVAGPGDVRHGEVRLSCKERKYDVGSFFVDEKPRVHHVFEVANRGTATVWVRPMYAYAGFRVGPAPLFKLEPGRVTGIPVSIRTKALRGKFLKTANLQVAAPPWQPPCPRCGLPWSSHPHGAFVSFPRCSAKPFTFASMVRLLIMDRCPGRPAVVTLGVAGGSVLVVLIAMLAAAVRWIFRRPVVDGTCLRCRYDLRGHRDGQAARLLSTPPHHFTPPLRCPDCGAPF